MLRIKGMGLEVSGLGVHSVRKTGRVSSCESVNASGFSASEAL